MVFRVFPGGFCLFSMPGWCLQRPACCKRRELWNGTPGRWNLALDGRDDWLTGSVFAGQMVFNILKPFDRLIVVMLVNCKLKN